MSNITSAIYFYFLGMGSYNFGNQGLLWGTLSQLIMFGCTELMPILSFIFVCNKFVGVVHPVARNGRPLIDNEEGAAAEGAAAEGAGDE